MISVKKLKSANVEWRIRGACMHMGKHAILLTKQAEHCAACYHPRQPRLSLPGQGASFSLAGVRVDALHVQALRAGVGRQRLARLAHRRRQPAGHFCRLACQAARDALQLRHDAGGSSRKRAGRRAVRQAGAALM